MLNEDLIVLFCMINDPSLNQTNLCSLFLFVIFIIFSVLDFSECKILLEINSYLLGQILNRGISLCFLGVKG